MTRAVPDVPTGSAPVHASAARGYAVAAETYAQGRPAYPDAAAAWLTEIVGLAPGRTVLELGAGGGKFTLRLAATGARVLALEPVAEMRQRLARALPDVVALAGTAQAVPLPDASVDAVVCAQSFHWFAAPDALAEIRRVLKPGGRLGLIWNVRDETVPWVAALSDITNALEGDAPRYRTGEWRRLFPAEGFEALETRTADNPHLGSSEDVIVRRTLSVSFIAALPDDRRAEVERRVRALVAGEPGLAGPGPVAFPYETRMYAWRRTG